MNEHAPEVIEVGIEKRHLCWFSDFEEARRAAEENPAHLFFDANGNLVNKLLDANSPPNGVTLRAAVHQALDTAVAAVDDDPRRLATADLKKDAFDERVDTLRACDTDEALIAELRATLDHTKADVGDRARGWCCFWNRRCC
jgi:hypothetical protein